MNFADLGKIIWTGSNSAGATSFFKERVLFDIQMKTTRVVQISWTDTLYRLYV
jgi:hypothetical protein